MGQGIIPQSTMQAAQMAAPQQPMNTTPDVAGVLSGNYNNLAPTPAPFMGAAPIPNAPTPAQPVGGFGNFLQARNEAMGTPPVTERFGGQAPTGVTNQEEASIRDAMAKFAESVRNRPPQMSAENTAPTLSPEDMEQRRQKMMAAFQQAQAFSPPDQSGLQGIFRPPAPPQRLNQGVLSTMGSFGFTGQAAPRPKRFGI
tara:strand:- start:58 stop:654 length:597 start_codon:yes stop_codon:yes gene_type:complete